MGRGPVAQACLDIIRLIGKAIVGGGDSRTGSKLSRSERKSQGATESARADRELKAGMAVVGAVVALIVGLFTFQASGGGGPPAQPIEALRVADAAAVKKALFGAMAVVIECTSPRTSGPNLLREAASERRLPEGLRAVSLDCTQAVEHFQLPAPKPSASPLLLLAGQGLSAPLVVGRHSTTQSLARYLRSWAVRTIPLLNSTLDLRRHCLSRPTCFVLITSGTASSSAKKAVLSAVGTTHAELGVVTLNRKTHAASFTAQLPETTRAVLLTLRSNDQANGLGGEARAFKGVITSSADAQLELEAFVAASATGVSGSAGGFTKLGALPRVTPLAKAGGVAAGEDMAAEELYDPMLSSKRYEHETALWY